MISLLGRKNRRGENTYESAIFLYLLFILSHMPSRNRVYDPTSDVRYKAKMYAQALAYGSRELAEQLADAKLNSWKSVFVTIYNAIHTSHWLKEVNELFKGGMAKGVIIRMSNYVVSSIIAMGLSDWSDYVKKFTAQGVDEKLIKATAIATICSFLDLPFGASYIDDAWGVGKSSSIKTNVCSVASPLSSGVIDTAFSALVGIKPVPQPRSLLYYYATGRIQRPVTAGTQGGVLATGSGMAPTPVSPEVASSTLDSIIAKLNRFVLGG